MTVVAIILPYVSTLIGAGITYLINVRTRRRVHVEDLFNEAMGAVAAATAAHDFTALVSRPQFLDEASFNELIRELNRFGVENAVKKQAAAREALARLLPYQPRVKHYYKRTETRSSTTPMRSLSFYGWVQLGSGGPMAEPLAAQVVGRQSATQLASAVLSVGFARSSSSGSGRSLVSTVTRRDVMDVLLIG